MRFIFTVTPGRSGQASLTELANRCGIGVKAAFEEPQIRPRLPGALGDMERHFRRRFVETHEILGRGDVLRAFAAGDAPLLERYAVARLDWIRGFAAGFEIFFDISKYFIRGLHRPLVRLTESPAIVFLVRDPIQNARSFVNRGKDFRLDNNAPSDKVNELPMADQQSPMDLYFWAWTEGYLRGLRLVEEEGLAPPVVIRTADLVDASAMAGHFASLRLPVRELVTVPPINTNESQGHGRTEVTSSDVDAFERWREKIPAGVWDRLFFMHDYNPRKHLDVRP